MRDEENIFAYQTGVKVVLPMVVLLTFNMCVLF